MLTIKLSLTLLNTCLIKHLTVNLYNLGLTFLTYHQLNFDNDLGLFGEDSDTTGSTYCIVSRILTLNKKKSCKRKCLYLYKKFNNLQNCK